MLQILCISMGYPPETGCGGIALFFGTVAPSPD